jgi:anti-repressor protein
MSPTPPRQPGWTCDCGSWNESSRTICRNCQTASKTLVPFEFPGTGQPVRTVMVDGQPWFVAADVCAVLAIGNPSQAVSYLDDDERSETLISNEGTPGNPRRAIVNEPGLYSLILRSRKPEAKAFKRWITHEVLPAIRRTGSYEVAPRFEIPQSFAEALELAARQTRALETAQAENAELKPRAEAWNVLASADPDYSAREAAYILNRDPSISTGQNRLLNELRRMRVIDSRDIPYANHERHVRLRPRTYTNRATNKEHAAKSQVRVTAAGLAYLHKKLGGTAPLDLRETENA